MNWWGTIHTWGMSSCRGDGHPCRGDAAFLGGKGKGEDNLDSSIMVVVVDSASRRYRFMIDTVMYARR